MKTDTLPACRLYASFDAFKSGFVEMISLLTGLLLIIGTDEFLCKHILRTNQVWCCFTLKQNRIKIFTPILPSVLSGLFDIILH